VVLGVAGTFALLKIVDLLIGVRVSEADEIEGLDLSQHGEEGYNTDFELVPVGNVTQASHTATEGLPATGAHAHAA
jgi:Amt family ammonium transporter